MKVVLILCFLMLCTYSYGHRGGLDQKGGHHDRKNGGYHYHNKTSDSGWNTLSVVAVGVIGLAGGVALRNRSNKN